jgi:uncharacterized protein YndB with AHSA1/START domain
MHEPKRIESRRNHDGSWYCVDSYVIGAPLETVFPILADLPAYGRWWPGLSVRPRAKEARLAPGARGALSIRAGAGRLACEYVVEEVVVDKKIRLLLADGGATGPLTLSVARVDDTCRASVIWDGVTVHAPLARLASRFLGPRALHRCSVRGLKGLEKCAAERRAREPEGKKRVFEWRGAVPGEPEGK